MVKAETSKSLTSASTAQDSEINQIIYDVQQWLASDWDWPHLRTRWDVNLTAEQRYISFPQTDNLGNSTSIDTNRMGDIHVFVKWNNIWQPVIYGIDEISEFNYLDSDRGMVLDPVQRWMLGGGDTTTFEIWPLPAGPQTLRFRGQRVLNPLQTNNAWDDALTLDMDDQMVAYFVIAEYCVREEKPNGKYFLGLAQNRMAQIRRTYPKNELPCVIGGAPSLDKRALRLVPMVMVAGGVPPQVSQGGGATITGPGGGAVGTG